MGKSLTLSEHAIQELSQSRDNLDGLAAATVLVTGIVLFISALAGTINESWKIFLTINAINAGFWIFMYLTLGVVFRKKHRLREAVIREDNKIDYERAQELKRKIGEVAQFQVTDFPVQESYIGDLWRPYRPIEHAISNSLRVSLDGEGNGKGVITPLLAEDSSLIFLEDAQGETLRVLVPSATVAREFLMKTIESRSLILKETHTAEVLKTFAVSDRNFIQPLTDPRVIDRVDKMSKTSGDHAVRVRGFKLREGLVVGTSIEIEGDVMGEQILFPSGYYENVMNKLSSALSGTKELDLSPMVKQIDACPAIEPGSSNQALIPVSNLQDTFPIFSTADQFRIFQGYKISESSGQ